MAEDKPKIGDVYIRRDILYITFAGFDSYMAAQHNGFNKIVIYDIHGRTTRPDDIDVISFYSVDGIRDSLYLTSFNCIFERP